MSKPRRKVHLMMGAPGSGKSSFIVDHIQYSKEVWISRDEIRFSMVAENEEYFSKEKEVFKEFIRQIDDSLDAGFDVFADATHLNRASRNKIIRAVRPRIVVPEFDVVWIKTSLDKCIVQNENRIGTRSFVPIDVIQRMYNNIEKPEFEEGFKTIYIVENNNIQIIEEE